MSLPDAELCVIQRLTALPAVIDAGAIVSWVLPRTRPAVVVGVAGGYAVVEGVLDRARIAVDVWDRDREKARALASDVYSALAGRFWNSDAGSVTYCETVMRPAWSPDPMTGEPRYIFTVDLSCRPAG